MMIYCVTFLITVVTLLVSASFFFPLNIVEPLFNAEHLSIFRGCSIVAITALKMCT